MKPIILLFSLVLSCISIAQTKLIAFKSHSGNIKEFYELVENRDIDMIPHNLGMAPQKIIKSSQLDTVIYVNDTTTVVITSVYSQDEYDPYDQPWLWSPGKDTARHDLVWNQKDPQKIKKKLKKEFNFRNSMDSVVFVGFPTETTKPKEEPINKNREAGGAMEDEDEEEDAVPGVIKSSFPGMGIPLAIVLVAMIAIFITIFNWRKQLFKAS